MNNNLQGQILDRIPLENDKNWYLIKVNLFDYVINISEKKMFNFSIQRKIVANKYLDSLLETFQKGEPIPNITLCCNEKLIEFDRSIQIEPEKINILDGLQRSYRMWAYWKLYCEVNNLKKELSFKDSLIQFKIANKELFETGVLNRSVIKNIFAKEYNDSKVNLNIEEIYKNMHLYFDIWVGFNEKEIIKKMLVLNAGHVSVTPQHQFELLFIYVWKDLNLDELGIILYREKDNQYTKIKSGNRGIGEYLFSTIIMSLISLSNKKPERISRDAIYRFDIDEGEKPLQYAEQLFDKEFIKQYLVQLKEIDCIFAEKYQEEGIKWFGKDTVMSGVLAAIGSYIEERCKINEGDYSSAVLDTLNIFKEKIEISDICIKDYNSEYNQFAGRSVNIGNAVRKIVRDFTYDLLVKNEIYSWKKYFQGAKS